MGMVGRVMIVRIFDSWYRRRVPFCALQIVRTADLVKSVAYNNR